MFAISKYCIAPKASVSPTTPNAPSNLTGVWGDYEVNLSWTDNSNNETGFVLNISDDGFVWHSEIPIPADDTSYILTGLNLGQSVWFRICAENAAGRSAWSNIYSGTTGVNVPTESMICWFDANELTGSNSDPINIWNDKSVNAYHVTSPQPANRPILSVDAYKGLNAVNITNGLYFHKQLTTTYQTNPKTVHYVIRIDSHRNINGYNELVSDFRGINPWGVLWLYYPKTIGIRIDLGTLPVSELGYQFTYGNIFILTFVQNYNGTNDTLFINGIQTSADTGGSTPLPINYITFGCNSIMSDGSIQDTKLFEVIQYDKSQTQAELTQMLDYFRDKYSKEPPSAPSNLTGIWGTNEVDLSWKDNSYDETGFVLSRSDDGVNWTEETPLPTDTITYKYTGLNLGQTVWFRICSENTFGRSAWSNIYSGTTGTPNAPTELVATFNVDAGDFYSVWLDWIDNSNNESNFIVNVSDDGITWNKEIVIPANTNYHQYGEIPSIPVGQMRYFRVCAENASGRSNWTNVASGNGTTVYPGAMFIGEATAVLQIDDNRFSKLPNKITNDTYDNFYLTASLVESRPYISTYNGMQTMYFNGSEQLKSIFEGAQAFLINNYTLHIVFTSNYTGTDKVYLSLLDCINVGTNVRIYNQDNKILYTSQYASVETNIVRPIAPLVLTVRSKFDSLSSANSGMYIYTNGTLIDSATGWVMPQLQEWITGLDLIDTHIFTMELYNISQTDGELANTVNRLKQTYNIP